MNTFRSQCSLHTFARKSKLILIGLSGQYSVFTSARPLYTISISSEVELDCLTFWEAVAWTGGEPESRRESRFRWRRFDEVTLLLVASLGGFSSIDATDPPSHISTSHRTPPPLTQNISSLTERTHMSSHRTHIYPLSQREHIIMPLRSPKPRSTRFTSWRYCACISM